ASSWAMAGVTDARSSQARAGTATPSAAARFVSSRRESVPLPGWCARSSVESPLTIVTSSISRRTLLVASATGCVVSDGEFRLGMACRLPAYLRLTRCSFTGIAKLARHHGRRAANLLSELLNALVRHPVGRTRDADRRDHALIEA